MRVMSFNANGIRAARRKGFYPWFATQDVDILCIQELKAQQHQLEGDEDFWPEGYHCFYEEATSRKGYSGVALYARREPDEVIRGMGAEEFDAEGRYIEARFGDLRIASLYAPSGSSGDHRQESKERYLKFFMEFLREQAAKPGEYLICGDWNIAHKEIDLKNWRGNKKNSGFLPHERAWMDTVFDDVGLVDVFRQLNPNPDEFTWWSNRGRAWANNTGWRIDYHVATQGLAAKATHEYVYREERLSDHAPLVIDYDIEL